MPDRVVREGILDSERVNALSPLAELFYRRLMSKADDYGRYTAHPAMLLAHLYPLQVDRYSRVDITEWLTECVAQGLVTVYAVASKPFLEIANFGQRLRQKRPKWPSPQRADDESRQLAFKLDSQSLSNDRTPLPMVGSETESESTTKTKSAVTVVAQRRLAPGTTTTTDAASLAVPRSRLEEIPELPAELLGGVRDVIADYVRVAQLPLEPCPPTSVVRRIGVLLVRGRVRAPVEAFESYMLHLLEAGESPRKFRWFEVVTQRALREGKFEQTG